MCVLAVARQAHPDGRDRLDDPAHSLAAQQRRDRQGVREAQERYQAGDTATEPYLRRCGAALISRLRSDSSTSSLERARREGGRRGRGGGTGGRPKGVSIFDAYGATSERNLSRLISRERERERGKERKM